jgi:hypothetical protein
MKLFIPLLFITTFGWGNCGKRFVSKIEPKDTIYNECNHPMVLMSPVSFAHYYNVEKKYDELKKAVPSYKDSVEVERKLFNKKSVSLEKQISISEKLVQKERVKREELIVELVELKDENDRYSKRCKRFLVGYGVLGVVTLLFIWL